MTAETLSDLTASITTKLLGEFMRTMQAAQAGPVHSGEPVADTKANKGSKGAPSPVSLPISTSYIIRPRTAPQAKNKKP